MLRSSSSKLSNNPEYQALRLSALADKLESFVNKYQQKPDVCTQAYFRNAQASINTLVSSMRNSKVNYAQAVQALVGVSENVSGFFNLGSKGVFLQELRTLHAGINDIVDVKWQSQEELGKVKEEKALLEEKVQALEKDKEDLSKKMDDLEERMTVQMNDLIERLTQAGGSLASRSDVGDLVETPTDGKTVAVRNKKSTHGPDAIEKRYTPEKFEAIDSLLKAIRAEGYTQSGAPEGKVVNSLLVDVLLKFDKNIQEIIENNDAFKVMHADQNLPFDENEELNSFQKLINKLFELSAKENYSAWYAGKCNDFYNKNSPFQSSVEDYILREVCVQVGREGCYLPHGSDEMISLFKEALKPFKGKLAPEKLAELQALGKGSVAPSPAATL